MGEYAFSVIDPGNRRFPVHLEVTIPVADVIRGLVRTFGLPEDVNYILVERESGRTIDPDASLSSFGVPPGTMLQLAVVRDAWYRKAIDRLVNEAKKKAREQLWDRVEDHLRQIEALEPQNSEVPELRRQRPTPPPPLPPPVMPPPMPAPAATSSGGGCFLVLLIVGGIVVAANWGWVKRQFRGEVKNAEGKITAGSGKIEIVDHNSVLDFAYQLFINGKYIGDVRNPAGGTTQFPVTIGEGEVVIELRYWNDNGARDTRLVIRINGGEFEREFEDDGKADRKSFRWRLEGR